jgi:hypothetical protein
LPTAVQGRTAFSGGSAGGRTSANRPVRSQEMPKLGVDEIPDIIPTEEVIEPLPTAA